VGGGGDRGVAAPGKRFIFLMQNFVETGILISENEIPAVGNVASKQAVG